MGLNKVKKGSNMYQGWITHTWNTVKGRCPHDCAYCYMKKWGEQPPLHFDEKELKTNLGSGNFIFVGSSCDMWAWEIPNEWIRATLMQCGKYPENKYLFQSKNPARMANFDRALNVVLGTTIETNRHYKQMGNAPPTQQRGRYLSFNLKCFYALTITIEPVMDFDLPEMIAIIKQCYPRWVNIGANTNTQVKLPEPRPEKIRNLIMALSEFTEVKQKSNLKRLIPWTKNT